MSMHTILQQVYNLLEDPRHWTRNVYARDEEGRSVTCLTPEAFSFCLQGALWRVMDQEELNLTAQNILSQFILSHIPEGRSVEDFNDCTNHQAILAFLTHLLALPDAEKAF